MEPSSMPVRPRAMRTPARLPGRPLTLLLLAAIAIASCGGTLATPTPSVIDTPAAAAAVIQARTPLFDTFGPLNGDMIGQDRWWEAQPVDGATAPSGWSIRFTVGWGDCPSGCIDRHAWTWTVLADGTVTFVAEEGSPLTEEVLAGLIGQAKGPGAGGRVVAGPTCPVERPGDPACGPRTVAGAVLVVKNAAGAEVLRSTTDGSGLFRWSLKAGDYTLEPGPVEGFMGTAQPMTFTVAGDGLAWLDVAYDTGIR